MSKKLNLDTFNEMLLNAGIPRRELLEMELKAAYGYKINKMEELVQALNENKPYEELLTQVNNIDSNCDDISRQLEALEELDITVEQNGNNSTCIANVGTMTINY